MNCITFTEFRSRLKELMKTLSVGKTVDLYYRSKLVGKIVPVKNKIK